MNDYIRKVNYYETDKMGIVHHSNYIRWLEEARIDYLDRIGCSLTEIERHGIVSPVTAVECVYKSPAVFGDTVKITVKPEEFKGVRLILNYTVTNAETDTVILTGRTQHCFTNEDGKPVIMKKVLPEADRILKKEAEKAAEA